MPVFPDVIYIYIQNPAKIVVTKWYLCFQLHGTCDTLRWVEIRASIGTHSILDNSNFVMKQVVVFLIDTWAYWWDESTTWKLSKEPVNLIRYLPTTQNSDLLMLFRPSLMVFALLGFVFGQNVTVDVYQTNVLMYYLLYNQFLVFDNYEWNHFRRWR